MFQASEFASPSNICFASFFFFFFNEGSNEDYNDTETVLSEERFPLWFITFDPPQKPAVPTVH